MYLGVVGATAKQKKKRLAGGGGSPIISEIIVATTTGTGNYANAVKIGLWDYGSNSYAYSNGIKDGSGSVLTTGTNPTRTIQTQSIVVSDYLAAFNQNSASVPIIIGGAIRTILASGHTNANKEQWSFTNSSIIQSSLTNGSVMMQRVDDSYVYPAPDRTIMNTGLSNPPYGIFRLVSGNRGTFMPVIRHGKSGVAANDCPVSGDSITLRLEVANSYNPGGNAMTKIHDIVLNFT